MRVRSWAIVIAVLLLAGGAYVLLHKSPARQHANVSVLHRGNIAEPETLDPPQFGLVAEVEVVDDLFEGLATLDAHGQPVPGAAESWNITDGGRTYTFHLRPSLRWSDGTPLTAADFVAGIRRTLDPATHAEFANFAYKIRNGRAVNEGKLPPSALAVSAPDDRTLVIQLEEPSPILILLSTWPLLDPLPRQAYARYGKDWVKAGVMVSNGPYTLKEWVPQGYVKLERNPFFHDARNVRISKVYFYPTDEESAALKRFRAGELDLNLRFPASEYQWLKRTLPGQVLTAPAVTVSYISFNLHDPTLADLRVRRALSLAIDRESLVRNITRNGEPPAYDLVPPSIAGYPAPHIEGYGEGSGIRVAQAKALLAQAGYGPQHPLTLTFTYPSSELGRHIAAALQSWWRAIGADVSTVSEDATQHYARVREHDYQIAFAGWQGRPDPEYFLYLEKSESLETNYGFWSDPEYDRLVNTAEATMDRHTRYALFAQAEKGMLDGLPVTPLYFAVNRALVKPYVKGFYENAVDFHPTRWMWLEK